MSGVDTQTRATVAILLVAGRAGSGLRLVPTVDALHDWMTAWLRKAPLETSVSRAPEDAPARIVDAALDGGDEGPPHARLRLRAAGVDATVLIAESSWQDGVPRASPAALSTWALRVLPFVLLDQANKTMYRTVLRARRRRRAWLVLPLVLMALLAAVPFGVALVALALAVVGLARIKVPGFAAIGRALERRVSAILGDSFVLTSSPTNFTGIVEHVAADLRWLTDRSEAVTIVASSQGAAIAHRTLRLHRPPTVRLLVTVGSALRVFHAIPHALSRRSEALQTVGWLLSSLMFISIWLYVVAAVTVNVVREGPAIGTIIAGLFWLGTHAFYLILFRLRLAAGDAPWYAEALYLPGAGTDLQWLDCFATGDPVPNGELFAGGVHGASGWPQPVVVHGEAMLVRDQRAYLTNRDQVLAELLRRICGVGGIAIPGFNDPAGEHLTRAWWRRRWRVQWLKAARALLVIVYGLALLRFAGTVEEVGGTALDALPKVLHDLAVKALSAVGQLVPGRPSTATLAGLLLAGALVVGLMRLQRLAWLPWEEHDLARFFRREAPDTGGRPFAFFAALTGGLGVACVVLSPLVGPIGDAAGSVGDAVPRVQGLSLTSGVLAACSVAFTVAVRGENAELVRWFAAGGVVFAALLAFGISGDDSPSLKPSAAVASLVVGGLFGAAAGAVASWLRHLWHASIAPWLVRRSCTAPRSSLPVDRGEESTSIAVRHPARLTDLDLARDDAVLVTAGEDCTARIWSTRDGRELACLRHPASVRAVSLSADGRHVATACADGTARVWSSGWRVTGSIVLREAPTSVAISPDGQRVAIAAGGVGIWRVAPHGLESLAAASPDVVRWSVDERRLVAHRKETGHVVVWDLARHERHSIAGLGSASQPLAITDDGTLLATFETTRVTVRDLDGGHEQAAFGVRMFVDTTAAAFDGNGVQLALGNDVGVVVIQSLDGDAEPHRVTGPGIGVRRLAWRGQRLAVGRIDGSAGVFEIGRGESGHAGDGDSAAHDGHAGTAAPMNLPESPTIVADEPDGQAPHRPPPPPRTKRKKRSGRRR